MNRTCAPRARFAFAFAALALLALPVAASAGSVCPPSEFACSDAIEVTTDPSFERTCFNLPGQFSYLAQDGIQARIESRSAGPNIDANFVLDPDDYTLVNIPAGQNASIRAILYLHGFVYRPADPDSDLTAVAQVAATISDITLANFEEFERVAQQQSGLTSFSGSIEIELGVVTGTPFRVNAQVLSRSKGAGSVAQITGHVSFYNLPQGADVYGCKGYRQYAGLPAHPTSWGAVKGTYR